MNRKEILFDEGQKAAVALGLIKAGYICPICGFIFEHSALFDGDLSEEHVPPKSVGGRVILLTCKECNNFAGFSYEHALTSRLQLLHQAKGISGQVNGAIGHIRLEIDGSVLNANLDRSENKAQIRISSHNAPKAIRDIEERFKRFDQTKTLKMSSTKSYLKKDLRDAHLKCAFLALTARFGYTYALNRRTDIIRQAILRKHDSSGLLFYFKLMPELQNGIMIDEQNGRAAIALCSEGLIVPWPSLPIHGFAERAIVTRFSGKVFDFPIHFSADLDFTMSKHKRWD